MTPAESWLLLGAVTVVTIALVVIITRLDRTLDTALERRRARRRDRVHGFDEAYRYQLAREAIARRAVSNNVRLGHHDSEREPNNDK